MPLEVIVTSSKSVVCSMRIYFMYIFFVMLCGQVEHTMSKGCWFVIVSIGIVVVVNVTILGKFTILEMFGVVEIWIADY